MHDLPQAERPRERLLGSGPQALFNAELLAILLRTGTRDESALDVAGRLLASRGLDGLQRASAHELAAERGLGPASAAQLKAALELGRRFATLQPEERPTITGPEDVLSLVGSEMAILEQEELRVLLLNTKNQVQAIETVYRGSVNTAQIRIGELLRDAVRRNCPNILAVHNHPSGDPAPSKDDIRMTRDLVLAGQLLDIDVLDHVIVGSGGRHVSLRNADLLNPDATGLDTPPTELAR
ncbi:MAG TPA: DNA repair protein RadC [Dehalococcoidia bacterium]|nr:DNA repair protein RadC [Dehalococcoidia bacterium]